MTVMSQMTAVQHRPARGLHLGRRTRAVIRFVARFVNPLTLQVAGRRWMPVVGVLRHTGRRSGRTYTTPLGMRRLGESFFIPLTFSDSAAWYRNLVAARRCDVTYLGRTYRLEDPRVVDYTAAASAFPRYERLQFRALGINEYLVLRQSTEA